MCVCVHVCVCTCVCVCVCVCVYVCVCVCVTYFAAMQEESVTPTTYTVVTTEKQVKLSYDVNLERALM